jgi:YtkA-like
MKKRFTLFFLLVILLFVAACSNEPENEEVDAFQNLTVLQVEFIVPESAEAGEKITLEAIVTYGEEQVTDADEVTFEYWEADNRENSIMVDAHNNGDGTYTAEVVFEKNGIYEMYAHTTAKDMHTMPKKTITIE